MYVSHAFSALYGEADEGIMKNFLKFKRKVLLF